MQSLKFCVPCKNHAGDITFNPVPKPRARTVRIGGKVHSYNPKAYYNWQCAVREIFRAACITRGINSELPNGKLPFTLDEYGKIIYNNKQKFYLTVMIYYKDGKGGDPESIYGGISDSIFKCDKRVGSKGIDFSFDKKNPRCEISLEVL